MALQHFFLDEAYLGSRPIPDYAMISGEGIRVNSSYILVCPVCAKVWGRLMHEHPSAYGQVRGIHCAQHGGGELSTKYANLYADYEPRELGLDWPAPALNYEIALLCEKILTKEKERIRESIRQYA
jgi:hypothetical protein